MRQLITDEMVQEAVDWLRDNSEESGLATGHKERTEFLVKETTAAVFLLSEGNNEERKALATTHASTKAAHEERAKAVGYEANLRFERKRHEINLELWRTEQSNMRSLGALE